MFQIKTVQEIPRPNTQTDRPPDSAVYVAESRQTAGQILVPQ